MVTLYETYITEADDFDYDFQTNEIESRPILDLEDEIQVVLILGGSQGSKIINEAVIDILPNLVEKFYIIHQTGKNNFKEVKETADLVLSNSQYAKRYKPFEYLDDLAMKMAAGSADLIISRAGSTIFEIALWGVPSILIPITDSNGDHQRKNAYYYARSGASIVIEENNLTPEIFIAEINRIFSRPDLLEEMKEGAKQFAKPDAGRLIARQIIDTLVSHEK
jgi:UDP-N-acetylglucosamine--N-acetylmuramyl-(pentapeptide) pyrophosphoryl-undecaprenol N-acetylglucosamine transferase